MTKQNQNRRLVLKKKGKVLTTLREIPGTEEIKEIISGSKNPIYFKEHDANESALPVYAILVGDEMKMQKLMKLLEGEEVER